MSEEPIRFERKGRRKRKNITMSAELIQVVKGVADEDDTSESRVLENAVWSHLVDRYGRERVLELVDDAQDEIGTDDRLNDSVQVEIAP